MSAMNKFKIKRLQEEENMERINVPIPHKSSSFSMSSSSREEKLRETARTRSMASLRSDLLPKADAKQGQGEKIMEVSMKKVQESDDQEEDAIGGELSNQFELLSLFEEVDQFIVLLCSLGESPEKTPEIPDNAIVHFIDLVEKEIVRYESDSDQWLTDVRQDTSSFLDTVDRASKLITALVAFSAQPRYYQAMNQIGIVIHHAMSVLGDEFHFLLADVYSSRLTKTEVSPESKMKRRLSFNRVHEPDRCYIQPNTDSPKSESPSGAALSDSYPEQSISHLRRIASTMIASGYEKECCQVFMIARHNAIKISLIDHGFDKMSIDDLLRMPWETLKSELVSWTKAFRHAIAIFHRERELCVAVFNGPHLPIADGLISDIVRCLLIQLLNYPWAVAMTKRSAEKLFMILDMYEALPDMISRLDHIFLPDDGDHMNDVKNELCSVSTRLGETALSLFCDLETSIKSETAKAPVLNYAVHPLTLNVINYIKIACNYKNTLEQVFKKHGKMDHPSSSPCGEDAGHDGIPSAESVEKNPFATKVVQLMDLLNANLEAKAKLYKDQALSNIFMMNNGRYIMQNIKIHAEIKDLLGESWCRKRSSNLRLYHKSYQRETWSRVLGCFRDEGLQVKGLVLKPVLKERLKTFNAMFEEIHKTQSAWLVTDEQLRSELRVSISAVVVPAYRSFIGRFGQYLDPGRQTEKYVKFCPEDLEPYINDLFDGTPNSVTKRS